MTQQYRNLKQCADIILNFYFSILAEFSSKVYF